LSEDGHGFLRDRSKLDAPKPGRDMTPPGVETIGLRSAGAYKTWCSSRAPRRSLAGQRIELLYGESWLPVHDYNLAMQSGTKAFVMKKTGWTPRWGKSGFGNPLNTCRWTMAVANGSLFVGTLGIRHLLNALVDEGVSEEYATTDGVHKHWSERVSA